MKIETETRKKLTLDQEDLRNLLRDAGYEIADEAKVDLGWEVGVIGSTYRFNKGDCCLVLDIQTPVLVLEQLEMPEEDE